MFGDIKFELHKRIMSFLLNRAKGDTYVDKLETSYKTNLVIITLLATALITTFIKLTGNYLYTKDVEIVLATLSKKTEDQMELNNHLVLTNKEQTETIIEYKLKNRGLEEDINLLLKRIKVLEKENRELRK